MWRGSRCAYHPIVQLFHSSEKRVKRFFIDLFCGLFNFIGTCGQHRKASYIWFVKSPCRKSRLCWCRGLFIIFVCDNIRSRCFLFVNMPLIKAMDSSLVYSEMFGYYYSYYHFRGLRSKMSRDGHLFRSKFLKGAKTFSLIKTYKKDTERQQAIQQLNKIKI